MNSFLSPIRAAALAVAFLAANAGSGRAAYVYLTEVPDYTWYAGCFGSACGNLMGYWDRRGMSGFYTGPTAGGVAPLNNCGANIGIRSMWATKAGLDGRPAGQPGHIDDYWLQYSINTSSCGTADSYSYENTGPDPYVTLGRAEHPADCIGDFIGLSQRKWTNMAGECDGNIDAYSFVYWDNTGRKRVNFALTNAGQYFPDIQSGLRQWTRWRGYDADVFTQLTDFNTNRTTASGFSYADVKAEIDGGFPVLCFLQPLNSVSRNLSGMPRANPVIHGVMIYGYAENVPELGVNQGVLIRTSWGSGDGIIMEWNGSAWLGLFPVRGVIGFHPKPKITSIVRSGGAISLAWDGPASRLYDGLTGQTSDVSRYCVQMTTSIQPANWQAVGAPTTAHSISLPDAGGASAFYRVVLIGPAACP